MPNLIEENTGEYLSRTLQECHQLRIAKYSLFFNVSVTLIFTLIGLVTLYCCAVRKKTPKEQSDQLLKDQKYVLNKIKEFQGNKYLRPM